MLLATLLCAAVAASPVSAAPDPEAMTVDPLALEMDPHDADVLMRKYEYDTSSFPATVVLQDGTRLPGRVEVKGETARLLNKKGVLIKLDRPHKWRGHRRISLNAMATDGSLMREWLSWHMIYALGAPAPDTGYLRLSINGKNVGIYYRIEWVGPNVFDRYGFGDDGDMFDPHDRYACADLTPASVRDPKRCWSKIAPGGNDFTSMRKLVAALLVAPVDTFHQFVDAYFHTETVINWIAATVLTENTTTYNNEYWPYFSRKTGKWAIMSWDYDRTFGRNADPFLPYPQNRLNTNFQYYYGLEVGALNPLRDKLLKNPVLLERLTTRISELVNGDPTAAKPWKGWFEPARMQRRISALRERMLPEVAADPWLAGQEKMFEEEVEALRHYVDNRVRYLRRVVLDDTDWKRDRAEARLPRAGGRVALTDGWGFLLADLTVRRRPAPGKIDVSIHRGKPELAPPGIGRSSCIRRTWKLRTVDARSALEADVTVEYLDENSRAREVGGGVSNERHLRLFRLGGGGWEPLDSRVNPLANTLSVEALRLPPGERVWLMACDPAAAQAVASR